MKYATTAAATLAALALVPAIACAQGGFANLLKTATDAVSDAANDLVGSVSDAIIGIAKPAQVPAAPSVDGADDDGKLVAASGTLSLGGKKLVKDAAGDGEDDVAEPAAASAGSFSFGKPQAKAVETVEVTAKGQGETVEAAKKDAVRNAIKMAVGELVGAKTLVENDELVEDKILTLSNAVVDQAFYGDARSIGNGLVEVPVKAVVKKGKLNQELEKVGILTGAVAGDSLAASLFSGRERVANAEKFFIERLKGFPQNVVEAVMLAKEDGSPDIAVDAESGHVFANVGVRVNLENYAKWAQAFKELLDQICIGKDEFNVIIKKQANRKDFFFDGNGIYDKKYPANIVFGSFAKELFKGYDVPSDHSVPPFHIVVFTPSKTSRSSWPATVYHLDFQMCKTVVTALLATYPETCWVEAALKDTAGEVVCSGKSERASGNSGDHIGINIDEPRLSPVSGTGHIRRNDDFHHLCFAPCLGDFTGYFGRNAFLTVKTRIDLGEVEEDDVASVAGYEVKVEYKYR